jgi:copper chaperone CopZ
MMKYSLLIAATVVLASCSTPEPEVVIIPAAQNQPVVQATANAEASLFVSGMTCEMGCKGAIESKLGKSEGVVDFQITFADSTAVVSFDSTLVSAEDITERIAAIGGGGLYSATVLN